MNGWKELDKGMLTLGVIITSLLVIYASKYDPSLSEWAKGLAASVFGGWLLVLRGTNGSTPGHTP